MLSETELAWMRENQVHAMPNQGVPFIYEGIQPDGLGGRRETWRQGVAFACRVGVLRGHEVRDIALRLESGKVQYIFTTSVDVTLKRRDRIDVDGVMYEVLAAELAPSFSTANQYLVEIV